MNLGFAININRTFKCCLFRYRLPSTKMKGSQVDLRLHLIVNDEYQPVYDPAVPPHLCCTGGSLVLGVETCCMPGGRLSQNSGHTAV